MTALTERDEILKPFLAQPLVGEVVDL